MNNNQTPFDEFEEWIDSCVEGPYARETRLPVEVIEEMRGRGYTISVVRQRNPLRYLYYVE